MFQLEATAYDWNFRLFGVDVRVSPWFWLISALLGWQYMDLGAVFLALWMLCVFFSILVHELGHVLMGRMFGTNGHILLYSFGGLAIGSSDVSKRWQRILVCLAGPFAQFGLLAIVYIASIAMPKDAVSKEMEAVLFMLFYINLVWPLFNLLPIYPLDGGQVARELLLAVRRDRGTEWSLWLSIAVCTVLALNSLTRGALIPWMPVGGVFFVLFFAMIAYNNYLALQYERSFERWDRW